MKKKSSHPVAQPISHAPTQGSLRAQVAHMRATHRAEHAQMAEHERLSRQQFVNQIHHDITQRLVPEVARLRAEIRAEHAEMAAHQRLSRQQFVDQIRAWLG